MVVAAAAPDGVFLQRAPAGVVFRVSRITAFVPLVSSTKRAVRVAMPLSRWKKFNAVRSIINKYRAGPAT